MVQHLNHILINIIQTELGLQCIRNIQQFLQRKIYISEVRKCYMNQKASGRVPFMGRFLGTEG